MEAVVDGSVKQPTAPRGRPPASTFAGDEEVDLIARLLYAVTNGRPPHDPEAIDWSNVRWATIQGYLNRARFVRDELKKRGWTSP